MFFIDIRRPMMTTVTHQLFDSNGFDRNYHRGSIPLWVVVPLIDPAYTWFTLVGILRQVPGR